MSLNKYEAFLQIVEQGSLTRAAEQLGYTQSGISHMISSLESELGFQLLLRSRAGVRLTDAGEKLLPAVRGMLGYREQLNQIVAAIHGMDAGTVRIGTFTSVAVHWLPEMIKQFQQDYPNIEFDLRNGDYYDVDQWLREGVVDIGFVHMPSAAGYECIPLVRDRLLAILPPEHPLAGAASFPIRAAAREPFISLPESSAQDARQTLDAAGVHPNIKFTTKDDYALISMVEHGLGMSIVPELLLAGGSGRLAALELDPPASRVIGLAVRGGQSVGPATARFVEHIRRWVAARYGAILPYPDGVASGENKLERNEKRKIVKNTENAHNG